MGNVAYTGFKPLLLTLQTECIGYCDRKKAFSLHKEIEQTDLKCFNSAAEGGHFVVRYSKEAVFYCCFLSYICAALCLAHCHVKSFIVSFSSLCSCLEHNFTVLVHSRCSLSVVFGCSISCSQ